MAAESLGWRIHAGVCWLSAGVIACGSFLLAPIKFSAQLSNLPQLLEVGKLQFSALHAAQWLLLPVAATWAYVGRASGLRSLGSVAALMLFVLQMVWLLPVLDRHTAMRIVGEQPPPSVHHTVYGLLELAKVALLALAGSARATRG